MTYHHSGRGTAEEIYRISAVLAGLSTDDNTAEQDQPTAAEQIAATADHGFRYRNISRRPFERRVRLADYVAIEQTMADVMPRMAESTSQKIFLPRRSGELPFAPQQYYYAASKSGVVPNWAISTAVHPA